MKAIHSVLDAELFKSYRELINPTYPDFLKKLGMTKVAIKAEGATITDSSGSTYIDCVGGYGLFNIGHNHPEILKALTEQLNAKELFTKPFITEIPVRLAEQLSRIAPGYLACSFLCNSGSEAIDSAIKLARLNQDKKQIIAAENSFHGYTLGALSVSGIASFRRFFEPLVPDIIHIPYGDIAALKKSISEDTAAVLLEPIQHEAGIFLPNKNYLKKVQDLCEKMGVIFILDEIKTGFGKTGRMFACDHFDVVPDILVVGKALGGGLIPIGALIAKRKLWKKFGLSFPMSASSFGGNILACRAALATIHILQKEGLLDDCSQKGLFLLGELRRYVRKYPNILVRANGLGLLIGIETINPQTALSLAKEMIRQRILVLTAFGNPSVLMFEPPLIISYEQIEKVLESFEAACEKSMQAN